MQSKISLKRSLVTGSIAGIAVSLIFLIIIFFLGLPGRDSYIDSTTLAGQADSSGSQTEQARAAFPMRLKIPQITVNAAVEFVGLSPDGAMDTPKEQGHVAWFKLGPLPGKTGSAVMAGHYGWKDGKPSVFDNLYKLRKGDMLFVEDNKGTITSFVVVDLQRFDPSADATSVFGSNDGQAHLNLITCEGVWDKVAKSYSKRLVVFTDKIAE